MNTNIQNVKYLTEVKALVSEKIKKASEKTQHDLESMRKDVAVKSQILNNAGNLGFNQGESINVQDLVNASIAATGLQAILGLDTSWENKKSMLVSKLKEGLKANAGNITKVAAVGLISAVTYKVVSAYYDKLMFAMKRKSEQEWNYRCLIKTGLFSYANINQLVYSAPLSQFLREHGPDAPVCKLERIGDSYKVSAINSSVTEGVSKYKVISDIEKLLGRISDFDDTVDQLASTGTDSHGNFEEVHFDRKLWDNISYIASLSFVEPEKILTAIDLACLSALDEVVR